MKNQKNSIKDIPTEIYTEATADLKKQIARELDIPDPANEEAWAKIEKELSEEDKGVD